MSQDGLKEASPRHSRPWVRQVGSQPGVEDGDSFWLALAVLLFWACASGGVLDLSHLYTPGPHRDEQFVDLLAAKRRNRIAWGVSPRTE